jgi:hypothetical protein
MLHQRKNFTCSSTLNSMPIQILTPSVVVLALALILLYWASKQSRLPLPPGPKGWPLIGNLIDVPRAKFVESYTKWAQKYGLWFGSLYRRMSHDWHAHRGTS